MMCVHLATFSLWLPLETFHRDNVVASYTQRQTEPPAGLRDTLLSLAVAPAASKMKTSVRFCCCFVITATVLWKGAAVMSHDSVV